MHAVAGLAPTKLASTEISCLYGLGPMSRARDSTWLWLAHHSTAGPHPAHHEQRPPPPPPLRQFEVHERVHHICILSCSARLQNSGRLARCGLGCAWLGSCLLLHNAQWMQACLYTVSHRRLRLLPCTQLSPADDRRLITVRLLTCFILCVRLALAAPHALDLPESVDRVAERAAAFTSTASCLVEACSGACTRHSSTVEGGQVYGRAAGRVALQMYMTIINPTRASQAPAIPPSAHLAGR